MEKNPKKLINDLAQKEDGKLNCEYDFVDETHKLSDQMYFIERIDSVLVKAYAVNCIFFAIPFLIKMITDMEINIVLAFFEGIFLKAVIFVLGWLGCKFHNYYLAMGATLLALFSTFSYDAVGGGVGRMMRFIFESNVIFFFITLVIACVSIAATIKFKGLNEHSKSTSFRMIDSKLEFTEHMAKMDRTRKAFLEEEKLNANEIYLDKTTGTSDLGEVREKKNNYMDEL